MVIVGIFVALLLLLNPLLRDILVVIPVEISRGPAALAVICIHHLSNLLHHLSLCILQRRPHCATELHNLSMDQDLLLLNKLQDRSLGIAYPGQQLSLGVAERLLNGR
ncbi:hypothetical protein B0T09DRAFT_379292 [Sordaria sp. MPI-SDFR-AT-0083]|nr:hypothetical protein B0T09DRAFT_379292 [Sordaria sp. MPI-SDFR-AT-0083]